MPMIKKMCIVCQEETWHNPPAPSTGQLKRDPRCTKCGKPYRSGNLNPKNIITRRWDGKILFGPAA